MIQRGKEIYMKKQFLFLFAFIYLLPVHAQKNDDLGIFGGTAYYLGELNPNGHFRPFNPAFGIIYRHNFNPFYSLRWNLNYASLSANNPDLAYLYTTTSFSSSVVEMGVQFEFNFLPFKPFTRFIQQATYVSGGLGMAIANKPGGNGYEPVIPFGLGWKLNINDKFSLAATWEFRKTFFDDMDGVTNLSDTDARSVLHNNDWYSFAGIILSVNLFNLNADCPAYWDN